MRRLTDGELDIIRELNADAAECERAWGREMTEEDVDELSAWLDKEFRFVSSERTEMHIDRAVRDCPQDDTEYPY